LLFEEAFVSWAKTSESKPACVIMAPVTKNKRVGKNVLCFFIKFEFKLTLFKPGDLMSRH